MSPEEFKGATFICLHNDVYISASTICDVQFTHREDARPGAEPGAGHKILEAEITTISGKTRFTHGKFAEDLLKLVQANALSN